MLFHAILRTVMHFSHLVGVHSIAYTFPQVRIVSSAVDPEINEKFFVKPGIGNFGDRYFGTGSLSTIILFVQFGKFYVALQNLWKSENIGSWFSNVKNDEDSLLM